MAVASARVQVIEEPMPLGDVPLAPSAATGRSEAELAGAIAAGPLGSASHSPPGLSAPLASVAALMRRSTRWRPDTGVRDRAA
jgi:hypothetical protein